MKEKYYPQKSTHKPNTAILGVLVTLLSFGVMLSGCIDNNPPITDSFQYSFESGFEGWKIDGTDLSDPDINWSIDVTDEESYDGLYSVRLYLDNMNDAGKIWIEKQFNVTAQAHYEVTISYMFGTRDYGDFNLFRIITGATTDDPETAGDLIFQDDTGHHLDNETGLVWTTRSYTTTVHIDESRTMYIMLGVWGTWETARTYYIDAVNISIIPLSLEDAPDISGNWMITYYDWMGNSTHTQNVTIVQSNWTVHINGVNETLCTGTLMKNTLAPPFDQSEYIISDCDFGGLGISHIYVVNETSMITDLPLCESCNPAIFTKIP
ncbi:MAG: hypothetical protein QCH96_02545 [Candidatus Thermoplasmatota archaeon]|nr:hypothetical protein [Candidatus Thermoplasmatota archaeon]